MTVAKLSEEDIFNVARRIEAPDARAAYLRQVCQDEALRARIEALLHVHEQEESFLNSPLPAVTRADIAAEGPGVVIGPYKLLQQIGEGGMGTVWMAEQTEPVQRRVALKIIKLGMDSKQVCARFEAERQALALMDHPNIAKVFDAGTTGVRRQESGDRNQGAVSLTPDPCLLTSGSGRPYFVMELVRGTPITRYCDEQRLTPRQRLELFVPVCQAIQHAHQKGIIHRDVKPSNVLVAPYDGKPVVKVIDFGVAKATGQRLTEKTLFTEFGAVVGTLEYMSPEQAELNNQDIDTRSDIYSLGVLLYELLTGTTPLTRERLKAASFTEMLRMVREEEPPRPSTRLAESTETLPAISAQRQMEPVKLTKLVRGELDWIVMKALEKDRNRRYESANGFAMDVERYLRDEPVQACPPSVMYRFGKFARRNKARLAIAGLALVFVVVLGWVALSQAWRAAALEQNVAHALEEVEDCYGRDKLGDAEAALKRVDGLLATGDVSADVQQGVRQWGADLKWVSDLAEIRLNGSILNKEGGYDVAAADAAYQASFQANKIDVMALSPAQASEQIRASRIKRHLAAALDDWVQVKGQLEDPGWKHLLAVVRQADPDSWRDRFREAYERSDKKALKDLAEDERVLEQPSATLLLLEGVLRHTGQFSLAVDTLLKVQARHPSDFWINHQLGYHLMLMEAAKRPEAVGFFRAALAQRPQSPAVQLHLSRALLEQGKLAEGEMVIREALRLDPNYAEAHINLGLIHSQRGNLADAEAELRKGIELKPKYAGGYLNLGSVLYMRGDLAAAKAEMQKALKLDAKFAEAHYNLALICSDEGLYREALAAVQRAHELGSRLRRWSLPSAKMVKDYERLAAFAEKVARMQRGENLSGEQVFRGSLAKDDPADPMRPKSFHKVHTASLEGGKVYRIDLVSVDFDPFLRLEDSRQMPAGENDDGTPETQDSLLIVCPTRTDEFRLVVTSFAGEQRGRYFLAVQELTPLGPPRVIEDKLTLESPQVKGRRQRAHMLKVQPGSTHLVDLESSEFDPLLTARNSKGHVIAEDDDSGGGLNARVLISSFADEHLELLVSTFNPGTIGRYRLRIQSFATPGEKHRERAKE